MNDKDKKILELLERVKSYIGTGLLRRNPFSAEEEVLLNDLERDIDSAASEVSDPTLKGWACEGNRASPR